MSTTTAKATDRAKSTPGERFAPVLADAAYALELFKQITGLDNWALRQARRAGLKVTAVGRRRFVRGKDFLAYLDSQSTEQG